MQNLHNTVSTMASSYMCKSCLSKPRRTTKQQDLHSIITKLSVTALELLQHFQTKLQELIKHVFSMELFLTESKIRMVEMKMQQHP